MEAITVILSVLNMSNLIAVFVQAGLLIVAVVTLNLSWKRQFEKRVTSKADNKRVDNIERKMNDCEKEKASIEYVDARIDGVHKKVDEHKNDVLRELGQLHTKVDMLIEKLL